MPLYEYECPECGRFEKIQKFSDKPLKKCPNGHKGIERLLSPPAIQFKGSGWYVTDYARKSEAKGDGKADGSAKSGDGGEKKASSDSSSSKTSSTPQKESTKKSAAKSKRSP